MPRLRIVTRILLAGAFVMATAITGLADVDKDELKVAKTVVEKLLAGADLKAVASLKKKTSPEALMALLATKNKGGVGFGPKGTISIEKRIQEIAEKGISGPVLAKEQDDLIRAVRLAKAVNDYNELYTPTKTVGGKNPKVWVKNQDEVKKVTVDLLDALKAKDAVKVTAAVKALDFACSNCHKVFKQQ